MEHGAVTEWSAEAAALNLAYTYLELGRATAGARVWQERGFRACTGPLDHPICNFAIDLELDDAIAARLRQVATQRRCFSLYTVPPIEESSAQEALEREGFALSHHLKILMAPPAESDSIPLAEIQAPPERRRISEFMVDQFFHRQPTSFRKGIAEATAGSAPLRLYKADWNGRTTGAVMLSEHAGLLGIYNLCVASQYRGKGWGSALVKAVLNRASAIKAAVTLQCEPGLASWYESLGFKEVGSVSVYGLFRFKEIDIMG